MLKTTRALEFTVDGETHAIAGVPADMHLGHFLREVLGKTGTRIGCSIGECRACTVMVRHGPGETPVTKQSCMISMRHVSGWEITTVQGLASGNALHPVQDAILAKDALQCGYCASGFAVAGAVACEMIAADPQQDPEAVIEAVVGHNLCRCTGYGRYREAIMDAALAARAQKAEAVSLLGKSAPMEKADEPVDKPGRPYATLFEDPKLELIRLLRDAAEIEHSLLVQYLFAAFSVRIPKYLSLAGWPSHRYGGKPLHILGVAIEEMIHLDVVNELLVALGAAPHLGRQQFPYEQDIYPFPFELEPLSLRSIAKYVYVEASARAIDPNLQTTPEDKAFVARLYTVLDDGSGKTRPNQVGSLYRKIEAVLNLLEYREPTLIEYDVWRARLAEVREEGEDEHFHLFRSLFDGSHPALPGVDVWTDGHADYPSHPLKAVSGIPPTGEDVAFKLLPALRHISNLHYWVVCMLLHQSYRLGGRRLHNAARRHMTGPIRSLASALGQSLEGPPFDPLPSGYAPGGSLEADIAFLRTMIDEISFAEERFAAFLPHDYARRCALETAQEVRMIEGYGGTLIPLTVARKFERKPFESK